jgi:pimeloyl-ACP methyl ester carboxylesterase
MQKPTLISVRGVQLEVKHIPGPSRPLAEVAMPACVFLHEGLGSVALWKDWPEQVCNALACEGWVYSRQGYGQSEGILDVRGAGRLHADYLHHQALVVLPELLRSLNISSPLLIGHSDGGTIALIHASQFPVAGCAVMAPLVMVEDISIQAISQARDNFDKLSPRLAAFHKDVDVAFWQWNDVWLSDGFRSFDIRSVCHDIRCPVLALQGVDDAYGTLRQIEEIRPERGQIIRHALANCGHSPHKDQAQATLTLVADFLADKP